MTAFRAPQPLHSTETDTAFFGAGAGLDSTALTAVLVSMCCWTGAGTALSCGTGCGGVSPQPQIFSYAMAEVQEQKRWSVKK